MRKRLVMLSVLLLAVAGVVGVLVSGALREREPEYGGKRLSEWMAELPQSPSPDGQTAAEEAIRHIGTNGLPNLLKWIGYETPPWKAKLYGAVNPVLRRMSRWWALPDVREQIRARTATAAFYVLGPKGRAAIGELTRMTKDTKHPLCRSRALVALGGLQEAGLPVLVGLLVQEPGDPAGAYVPLASAGIITHMGTNARPAVGALLDLLKHPDAQVRDLATNVLRKVDPQALEAADAR